MHYLVNGIIDEKYIAKYFNTMKTKSILTLGFGSAFILLLVLSATVLIIIDRNVTGIEHVINQDNTKLELIHRMRTAARERTLNLQKMLLTQDAFEQDDEWIKFNNSGTEFVKARLQL